MEGSDHAKSGLAVGFALAAVVGYRDPIAALPFATVVAGYALTPDLDCAGSTETRLLGPVTRVLSWVLTSLSAIAYRLTATRHDKRSTGTHRHLTHTALFAAGAGVLAAWTGGMSPWATLGWLTLGVLGAAAATSEWLLPAAGVALAVPMLLDHATPLSVLASVQPWIGAAVATGCLTHCIGDAVTVTGVPLLWPLPIGGATWADVHLLPGPVRLHTGRRMERWVVSPVLTAACAATPVLLWPAVTALVAHHINLWVHHTA